MKGTQGKWDGWLWLLLALAVVPCVEAVILEGTGDPSYNTNAPTGSLTNSGWQYEGQWNTENGPFLGTPIAPTFFLAAQHVGGTANLNNDQFTFEGSTYTLVTNFDDPDTDLRIWQVGETFPYYAPLYTGGSESGQACVVMGRGYERGPVIISGHTTNGWQWGATYGVERWGQNIVLGVTNAPPGNGELHPGEQRLYAAFQPSANSNECDLAAYDSSGGMFIENGTTWQLAGINYEIGEYLVSTNADGANSFSDAALMDLYGLYVWTGTEWLLWPYHGYSTQFFCTRVSARVSWINSILNASPTAIFSASPTNGAAPLTVTFTDSSIGPVSNRFWSFGDGGTTSFVNATNPTHTYTAGVYSVTLIVSGVGGSGTDTVANLISVYDPYTWWQLNYFGCTNNGSLCAQAAPNADPYGTGMSNTNKFLAGFNPTNTAAYLHVISIATTNTTGINVIYLGANGDTNYVPGVASRTNILEYSTGTAGGNYNGTFLPVPSAGATNILSGGTGTGIVANMVDPGGATNTPSRYYRVRVLLP
jgi:PKD repeat protein